MSTFSFLLLINNLKFFFCVWWLGSNTKYFLLVLIVISLISQWFLTFCTALQKTASCINLKKYFYKSFLAVFLGSVFISVYGFNKDFSLNLMPLCTFFNTNPRFNACFTFLIFITYSFYHTSWLQVFQFFQFSLIQVKMENHCESHVIFWDFEKMSCITIFITVFK